MKVHRTDIAIIGAGPCGLFTVFEAGLLGLKCHLVDSLQVVGGQLAEIYPKKPIYDIPGIPDILASDLVANLKEQIKPFHPQYSLGETVIALEKNSNDEFELKTNRDTKIISKVVAIAGGLGNFEPRKPQLDRLDFFEDKGVDYMIRDPEKYRNKKIVLAGGGDSALDWAIYLVDLAQSVTLVHRRSEFRGAPESVNKLKELVTQNRIELIVNSEVKELLGNEILNGLIIQSDNQESITKEADYFIPLFGLVPKLGPIADWGLNLNKSAIEVNTFDYATNVPGIFAIGDINTYPGKLKLILCGFHEATLMVQSAYKIIHKGKNPSFKYTTVTGIKELK